MTEPHSHFLASANSLRLTEQEKNDARELLQFRMQFPRAFATLIAAKSAFTLTADEKMFARVQLVEAMHAAKTSGTAGSFLSLLSLSSFSRIVSTVTASFCIVFMSGGVLTYAAESALPGDVLYSVKVSLNEPVIELFQRTPQEKALWVARRFERRLSEARTLVAKATVERQRDAKTVPVPAMMRMNSGESSPEASDALTVMATAKTLQVTAPDREDGLTEKEGEVLDELVNAGVPEMKIQSWMRAIRGEHTESSSDNESSEEDDASSSSSQSQSTRSSSKPEKNILPEIFESGMMIRSSSAKSRKNRSSSSDASSSLSSSRDDSDASGESSSSEHSFDISSSSVSSSESSLSMSFSSSASRNGESSKKYKDQQSSSDSLLLPLPPVRDGLGL